MNKTDIKHTFTIFALSLIILSAVVTIAAADTSVAWAKDIGDVTAADMSEDGSVIYAAVGSQIFVYDAAGVQQNVFTVGGTVVKLVCTADGSKAALYTDGEEVYYIDNGVLTWSQSFTAITDIDISNIGSVLVIESDIFHKYQRNGTLEYNSPIGTYVLGVIDPDDEFAIVNGGDTKLHKYILTTTNRYWGTTGTNTAFNTAFMDYNNCMVIHQNTTDPIQINKNTISDELYNQLYPDPSIETYFAISDSQLTQADSSYTYQNELGTVWQQSLNTSPVNGRSGYCVWYYNNTIFVGGGYRSTTRYNDVWSSHDGGETWTQLTSAAQWSTRIGSLTWVFNGKLWLAGGSSSSGSSTAYNDVWYSSDGVSWTQATSSAQWSGRFGASTWVFNDKLWLAGGAVGRFSYQNGYTSVYRDVWSSSDGVSWTQATSSAQWSSRGYASAWVFNGKLWLAGGQTVTTSSGNVGTIPYRDVWSSTDGSSWTQAATPQWSARANAPAWVYNNRLWIGGSGVWSSTDGSSWTQETTSSIGGVAGIYNNTIWVTSSRVLSTYRSGIRITPISDSGDIYLFYNYSGNNPQHTQTTYNSAVDFSGIYELKSKPTLSIYDLQTTKTLTGNIQAISLSDRGDWLGTATASRIYHDQITSSGFGTEYSAALGSTGTIYDIATANSAAMSVLGQGQITDIYSMSASRVGTYTAGGAVTHVDIADKNALWAASGGEDGKVYVFSKDASSNWYLEYSSDSENPITALRMSARGEYILAGRTNSLTLYQTNTPTVTTTDFWFTLYAYKDSDSYRNAAINVSVYSGNQWNNFAQGLTDSAGKYVVQLTAGQTYKFDVGNGQKVVVVMASPSVQSQTVNIHTSPISEAISYEAKWNEEINGIDLKYNDNSGQTNSVTVKVQRTDTWETVYEQTFTDTQNIDEQLPIVDDTTSYKVQFSANRVSGTSRNSFVLSSSRDIIPIPLDQNIKNVLFSCFLIVLAGLFSYMSAIRGALVVAFSATLFVYLGWLTIPWHWLIIAIVIAIVAGFTQRRG